MNDNGKCCAIIPAYEEGLEIAGVVTKALEYAKEVFVVDDGSMDNTSEEAAGAGAMVIRHERNLGKGTALLSGVRRAIEHGYEIGVFLDGDGQHDPAEIPKLVRALREGADMVVGCRMSKPDGMPSVRLFTNMAMSAVLGILTKKRILDTQSGFKAIRLKKLLGIDFRTARFDWESELIIKAARRGLNMREVRIKSIYMNHHRSKIKVFSDTLRFFRLILTNIIY